MLPLENGFRGTVTLGPGTFVCTKPIVISASGVVLRGNGSGGADAPNPGVHPTLRLAGTPHTGITVRLASGAGRGPQPADGSVASVVSGPVVETKIADDYVPCGTRTFAVADATNFSPGDTISIQRPGGVTPAMVDGDALRQLSRT
jgi:hypothetical protein